MINATNAAKRSGATDLRPALADALTLASAKQNLSELLRVSWRLSLAPVVRQIYIKGEALRGNRVARVGIRAR